MCIRDFSVFFPDLLPPPVRLGISVRVWHFIKWNFYIIRMCSFVSNLKAETSFLLMVNVCAFFILNHIVCVSSVNLIEHSEKLSMRMKLSGSRMGCILC